MFFTLLSIIGGNKKIIYLFIYLSQKVATRLPKPKVVFSKVSRSGKSDQSTGLAKGRSEISSHSLCRIILNSSSRLHFNKNVTMRIYKVNLWLFTW